MMAGLPWLPPMRKPAVAVVNLANCNGCTRCMADCPYNAITMQVRSDGRPFEGEAVVDPSLCVACGICAGACPTSTPFRRMSELIPGIDAPGRTIASIDGHGCRVGKAQWRQPHHGVRLHECRRPPSNAGRAMSAWWR